MFMHLWETEMCKNIQNVYSVNIRSKRVIFRGNGNKNKILLIVQYRTIYMSHNMLMIYKN